MSFSSTFSPVPSAASTEAAPLSGSILAGLGLETAQLERFTHQRIESVVRQVEHKLCLSVPENSGFHADTIKLIGKFNHRPFALQQAILQCAARLQAGLPASVRKALSEKPKRLEDCIQYYPGGPNMFVDARKKWALTAIDCYHTTSKSKMHQLNLLKAEAECKGLVIDWEKAVEIKNQTCNPWQTSDIISRHFCLVELSSNLPILNKCYAYSSTALHGQFWRLDEKREAFNGSARSDDIATQLNSNVYRLADFFEIVALLSSVTCVTGLPIMYLADLPASS